MDEIVMIKRCFAFVLTVVMLCAMIPFSVSADAYYTETLDIAAVRKDFSGEGYQWQNLYDILTLTNIKIETESNYGLKIPENATVILKGDNYIKASEYAVHCLGGVTFEGDGTLTLVSETGIICASLKADEIVRFRSGKINISGCETAIYSENSTLTFTGTELVTEATKATVNAQKIVLAGGSLSGTAPIVSKDSVEVSAAKLDIKASSAAITAVRGIKISGCDISVGSSAGDISRAQEYNGENCISTVSNVKVQTMGTLFNGRFPKFVDYIVFAVLFVLVVAVVAIPIVIKQRKTARLIAEHEKNFAKKTKNKK